MQKIALLTDSASDITNELMDDYNIKLLPFRIIFSDKEYEDRIDIQPQDVYPLIEKEFPKTSLPNPEKVEELLCKLEEEGYTHVISINISSNLSGTANSVRLLLEEHPKLISYVYDSKTLTGAQGAIVLSCAKMIREGKTFEEIIESLPSLREKSHCYFTVGTLEYLKKGGRIGKVAGTIGELLNLKPIIVVGDDGIYHTYAKIRGRKQAMSKLEQILDSYINKSKCNVWVMEGNSKNEAIKLYESLKNHENINEIHLGSIGPALSVHTGPGLFGLIIQEL